MKSQRIFYLIVLYILALSKVTAQVVPNAISQPNEKFKIEFPKDVKKFDTSSGGIRFKNVSAYTAMFLGEYKRINSLPYINRDSALKAVKIKYGISSIQGKDYMGAFILLENKENIISLINLGVKVNGEPKNLITALIPINILELVSVLPYIKHIEIGTPVYKNDIISRSQSRADSVNKGILLPSGYNGKGVVVGIIDEGFDFTHPNFYDSLGRVYRIKRVWNQKDKTGTSPNGFYYGSEYTTTAQILGEKTDDASGDHGSHVTGLAAGSGFGNPDSLKGISNEAEIVLVATSMNSFEIVGAIQYLINYAKSVNKPLVINTSLGSNYGPHDGTSVYNYLIDSFLVNGSKPSNILVASAGNKGFINIHSEFNLSKTDSEKFTFIKPLNIIEPTEIICYGNKDETGEFLIGLYDTISRKYDDNLPFRMIPDASFSFQQYLTANMGFFYRLFNSEKIKVSISSQPNDTFTKKVSLYIEIDENYRKIHNNSPNKYIVLGFKSQQNNFHCWINNNESSDQSTVFWNLGSKDKILVNGDNNITLSETGGVNKSTISVGALNSNLDKPLTSYGNTQIGNIAAFSSKGYTVDGRVKPDISASGNYVISSFNSWNKQSNNVYQTYPFKGRQYPYAWDAGTSMASPVVAGVIGLWLQASPLLSSNQAKYIIQQTAIRDNFTGITPNSSYGYGKINAYGGIKLLLSLMPPKPTLAPNTKDTLICSKDTFTLKAPSGYASYLWYNGTDLVGTTSIPTYKIRTAGSYFCAVQGNNGYWSTYSDTVNIRFDTIPVFPTITISTTQNNCTGIQNYLLTSTPGFTYQWYKNDTAIVGANTQLYSPISSGLYKVRTSSKNNTCSFLSDSVVITKIVPNLNRLFNSDSIKICGSDSVNLIPITNYNSYLWSTGSTKDMIAVKTTGLYKLTAYCGISSNNNAYEQFSSSNNSTKYITVSNASQLNFSNEMSILLKTRIEGPYGNSTLFEKGNDAYRLTLDANSSALRFSYTNIDNTVGLKYTLTPSQVQNADWFYIGIVKRSDSSFFYVNGLLVDKAKTTNPIPVNANNLIFGTGIFPNAGRYNGSMDDISLWNRALSQNEVSQYGKCMQGSETGCVGYYNFEGTNPMLDRTIYTNNAIQNGTTLNYPANQITTCSPLQIRDSIFVSIINPSISPKNASICINSPLQITSKIQTSPVKRVWSTGDTSTSIVVKPKSDTIYSITISDNYQSCTDSAVIQVSAPNTAIDIIGKKTFCLGDSAILFAPVANNKFQWLRNNIPIEGETKNMFTAQTNGSYRVICFNTLGCSDTSAAIIISVNQNPMATVLPSGPVSFCAGDSILLSASAGFFYQWYRNSNSISAFNSSLYVSSAGNYHVIIVDSNGCRSNNSNTVIVNVNPLPVVSIKNPVQNFICQGGSLILNASGKYKYQWFNNSLPIAGATDSSYTAYTGGVFTLNIIDSNGCKNSSSNQIPINLIQRVKPDFSISSRCISDMPRIKNLTDTIKAGAIQWNWKLGSNVTSTLFEPVLTVTTPQTPTLSLKVLPANCPELADSISRIYQFDIAPPAIRYPVVNAKKMIPVKLMARNIGIGYKWVPPAGLDTSSIISPRATLSNNQIYLIHITTNAGCIVTDTLNVRMVNNYGVFVPSGFSPDGDGVNDILRPICVGIKELRYFKVLNRWGQLLFETNQMFDGWDGNYNGRPQPPDTYVWVVEALDIDGNLIRMNGKSTLIR